MARLLMVLSSISPLFIFWATRGIALIPACYLLGVCGFMIVAPNAFLWLRVRTAIRLKEQREIVIGAAEDHRDHLLVYLFAMLLPLYAMGIETWRDVATVLEALAFVVFLFWHLNLHYMNLLFAACGYRVFTIYPQSDTNPLSGRASQVLITRRVMLLPSDRFFAYRVSDTVYIEVDE